MDTLRIKRKLAAMARETDEFPKNNRSQKSPAPGITEECIAQVSEEVEGKVTEKLSQEVSRTESCILRALSKLDEFRNADLENQEPSRDRSQNYCHPEVEFSACRASNLSPLAFPNKVALKKQQERQRKTRSGLTSIHTKTGNKYLVLYGNVRLHVTHKLSTQKNDTHEDHKPAIIWSRKLIASSKDPKSCTTPDKIYIVTYFCEIFENQNNFISLLDFHTVKN